MKKIEVVLLLKSIFMIKSYKFKVYSLRQILNLFNICFLKKQILK